MTDDLQQARVEAAAKALYEVRPNGDIAWDSAKFDDWMEREDYRVKARAALAAADAHLPSVEQIAEVIMRALVFTNENSKPWADGVARDVRALFGEVAGDE